jgi:flavorubredoxin
MTLRKIREGVFLLGAVDWDRRLFDSLIPLPDGTSYNAYLIRGEQKTALLDSVDPTMVEVLLRQLNEVDRVDYVVSHHAEQDHSGAIPAVLARYPAARVISTPQAKGMLVDLLAISEDKFVTVQDGETLSLGSRTLEFIHTPWVHWPETMCTFLREQRILFSCDFFGSHLATSELYSGDGRGTVEAAKRYYAEIMMPFRKIIQKNLEKVGSRPVEIIAPSHGPVHDRPAWIIDAYLDWVSDSVRNIAVIPYVSMHGSTEAMIRHLVGALTERGVEVRQFSLPVTDIGRLAIVLVDAASLVLGTPTVHAGLHPLASQAVALANLLRPKLRFATVIGSFGWSSRAVEQVAGSIPNLMVEILTPVLTKGYPREQDFLALENLAETILRKHREIGAAKETVLERTGA